MKCYYCKGKLKLKKITHNINRKGYDVILRDVPALVCQDCGEIFFEEQSVNQIQSLIENIDKKAADVRNFNVASEKIKPVLSFG